MRKNLLTIPTGWGGLSYRKNGDYPGLAVILIHGAVGDSRLYRGQMKYFGARYKTIALDLPGHGYSRAKVMPALDDFISSLESIISRESIESCVLIGHSMGGGVCLEAVARGVRGIAGLVLVSTAPVLPVSPDLVRLLEGNDTGPLAEVIVGKVFSKQVDLLVGIAKNGLYGKQRGEIMDIIRNDIEICDRMDYTDALPRIDIPVLIIANRFDKVISSDLTASLHRGIKNSRFVIFDEGGHIPFFENPGPFNAEVDAFLKSLPCR